MAAAIAVAVMVVMAAWRKITGFFAFFWCGRSWANPTQPYPIFCSKAQPSHAAQHRTQPSHTIRSNTPHAECSSAAMTPRSPRTTQQRRAPAHDPTTTTSTDRRPCEGDAASTPHPAPARMAANVAAQVQWGSSFFFCLILFLLFDTRFLCL